MYTRMGVYHLHNVHVHEHNFTNCETLRMQITKQNHASHICHHVNRRQVSVPRSLTTARGALVKAERSHARRRTTP